MVDFIQNIIDEIIDQYMFADNTKRPWIIGFSGGKDSTVMLQLVWKALEQVKHFHGFVGRDIYVVCNDTMVENPVITEYVYRIHVVRGSNPPPRVRLFLFLLCVFWVFFS